ncbi:hypothetical protein JMJ94_19265 [Rhodovulum visakhapatnamense]|nr:hypothetical protein [Rhodovulum visakhapatnamense]MBL3571603.1 hypothetical protein [Rhodovulum visakhapatnamense]
MAVRPSLRSISGLSLGASIPVQAITSRGAIVSAIDAAIDDLVLIPRAPDVIKNIFEKTRPGRPALRVDDLLALRIELRNCEIVPGRPPKLRKTAGGTGRLILHFPPQTVTEETFFQPPPPRIGKPVPAEPKYANPKDQPKPEPANPAADEALREPPIRARIADESRLSFLVPEGFEIDYTLEGVLAACQTLTLSVASNARPRSQPGVFLPLTDLIRNGALNALSVKARAQLAGHVASSFRLAASEGGDITTLRARQASANAAVFERIPDRVIVAPGGAKPRPGNPTATTTAIEMPWRLIVSPHGGAKWRHATRPALSASTAHVELWHTRMVTPGSDGTEIPPPYADPARTIRAVWARSGTGSEAANPPMRQAWPTRSPGVPPSQPNDALPVPGGRPFRMPLDDFDRFQIAHLSSNFSVTGYTPEPVDTNLMMLSSLGGWLDSRGSWNPPGLSVEEWVHRGAMGRDHYVKVVYRGCLCPLNCRVSLVKVTERKFHKRSSETPGSQDGYDRSQHAYLRQRYFIIIRERVLTFDDALFHAAKSTDNTVNFARQFPFSKIEILTERTPDLDDPADTDVSNAGQLFFWPSVNGEPFRFQCAGTDLDGNRVLFDLPMIFMDNTVSCPRIFNPATERLDADYPAAAFNAATAAEEYAKWPQRHTVPFDFQRVALATSARSGDTAVEVEEMVLGAEAPKRGGPGQQPTRNATIEAWSRDLSRALFLPKIVETTARLGPVNQLTGSTRTNRLSWNARYLQFGFAAGPGAPVGQRNVGEVFADIVQSPNMGMLDFSSQGDKSGGFVQPNLRPRALSRMAGPVMSDVTQFLDGQMESGAGFPISVSDLPLPLLFGCIPLGELIKAVTDIAGEGEKVPRFVSEAGTQVESFIGALVQLFGLTYDLPRGVLGQGAGGLAQAVGKIADLSQQGQVAPAALQAALAKLSEIEALIAGLGTTLESLSHQALDGIGAAPDFAALPGQIATIQTRIAELLAIVNGPQGDAIPANLRQQIRAFATGLDTLLEAVGDSAALFSAARDLWDALDAIVGDPTVLANLLSDGAGLEAKINDVIAALGPFEAAIRDFDLLGAAPKTAILTALGAVREVLEAAADLARLIEALTGDELTIRFDWAPEIGNWPAAAGEEIFRANDKRGFVVAVEGKVKKNGSSSPKIAVTCSLNRFDLVLIGKASFLELNFDRIVFSVDSAAKMDVDVVLDDIRFVGPLSFVETLRDLIPLDGFSDPPYLDITPQGIHAGFDIALPSICVGVLNINNLSLGAGFTVPFIGQPLSVAFNFCTREQPFCLTVYCFGGGGFFGVTIDPRGVQILEAALEFGASLSVDFGVASGGVEVMAGIYYRMELQDASLTGYFRLGGHVSVLGLISASLELYLELRYEFSSGKCVGMAQLTIEVSVLFFSGSVTIRCQKKFAGSNGDPTLREMMGFDASLPLADELAAISGPGVDYAWRDYVEAFG